MIYGKCMACRKNKWFIRKRSYIVPKVSQRPITSDGELCSECFKAIKKMTLQ